MEEEYKEIELRSEEVQEVMNAIPPVLLRYGIGVLLGVICLLFLGSMFFSIPDTVETSFTLTSDNPPAYIQAGSSGRLIHLEVSNNQSVEVGTILGVLENVGETQDVLMLRERLRLWRKNGARIEDFDEVLLHGMPRLGDVQDAYSACQLAWSRFLQSPNELGMSATMLGAASSLQTAMSKWESTYLLESPAKGQVNFMQLWKPLQQVSAGETLFVIVPEEKNIPVGKALLPADGAGKVMAGQRVIIRLAGFPEQEFGYLEGKVSSISPVPDADGMYVVGVSMPRGVVTSHGKTLSVQKVMTGSAEIVTRERSLFRKLLNL